ncbi:hypothetical protein UA44_01510 [Klebsiella aerogenes]|nr:hypothetical protein UA44_01510 [Klebsiella aerogenes]
METSALSFKAPSSSGPAIAGTTIAIDKDKLQRDCSQLIKKLMSAASATGTKTALTQGLKGNYEQEADGSQTDNLCE